MKTYSQVSTRVSIETWSERSTSTIIINTTQMFNVRRVFQVLTVLLTGSKCLNLNKTFIISSESVGKVKRWLGMKNRVFDEKSDRQSVPVRRNPTQSRCSPETLRAVPRSPTKIRRSPDGIHRSPSQSTKSDAVPRNPPQSKEIPPIRNPVYTFWTSDCPLVLVWCSRVGEECNCFYTWNILKANWYPAS